MITFILVIKIHITNAKFNLYIQCEMEDYCVQK